MQKFISASAFALVLATGMSNVSLAQIQTIEATSPVENRQPAVSAFAHLSNMNEVSISATGKYLAWLDGDIIVTYDMATGEQYTLSGGANHPMSLQWAGDEHLIVQIRNQYESPYWDQDIDFAPYLILSPKAEYIRPLFPAANKDKPNGAGSLIKVVNGENPVAIVSAVNNSGKVRLSDDGQVRSALFRVDMKTGDRVAIEIGREKAGGWVFDSKGVPRIRIEVGKYDTNFGVTRPIIHVKIKPDSPYTLFELPPKADTVPMGFKFVDAENAVYWTEYNRKTNHSQIWSKNLDTGEMSMLTEADGKDLSLIVDGRSGKRLGYATSLDRFRPTFTDPFFKQTFEALHKALPGLEIWVEDRTDDFSMMVISAESPNHPPIHYLYDTKAKTLDIIGESYPDLAGAALGETDFVTYKASDDLDIHAYVTKRKDLKLPAPTIVMVHGGPATRDGYGFDWWAQFFANRGYVVLQPQYRGSSGFGDAFQKAGDKQWGRKMNSDLVDGVNYLVKAGISDPKKVCVHGWSYGGYATMAAMTLSPEVWACGIEGAGVADPIKMINWVGTIRGGDEAGNENSAVNYWKSVIGDPRVESAQIKQISPVENVNAMKAPMLLFHGDKDIVVDPNQSRFMWEAMQKFGKQGKLVMLPDEDHHLTLAKSRYVFLSEMEAFLKVHNPSDYNK